MKILIMLNKSEITGPNIVALTNAGALYQLGCDVRIVFLRKGIDLSKSFSFLKYARHYTLPEGFFNKVKSLNELVKNFEPEIIHSHCFFPDVFNFLISLNLKKIKPAVRITTVHNIPTEDYLIRYGKSKGKLLLLAHDLILRSFKHVICISQYVSDSLTKIDENKKTVIYNPVSDFFNVTSPKPKDKLTIIYCGHFTSLKNPLFIIQVLSSINLEFEFIGLGDGELLSICKEKVHKDKRFKFAGRVNNVYDYFKKAHCLIHFSQTEGFCLSVAEALSSEMYVISNDLPVFFELKKYFSANNFYILDTNENIKDKLKSALYQIKYNIDSGEKNTIVAHKVKISLSPLNLASQHKVLYTNLFCDN